MKRTPMTYKNFFSTQYQKLVIMLCLFLLLIKPSIEAITTLWLKDENYNHGFFILSLSTFYFFNVISHCRIKNSEIKKKKRSVTYFILGITLYAAYLIPSILSINILEYALIPILLFALFVFFFEGKDIIKILFPTLFLYFSLPIWDILNTPLQKITIFINQNLLSFFNIPIYVENISFTLPQGTFNIENGCSGLRYFIVMLSLFFLQINHEKIKNKHKIIALFFLSFFLSLFINWLRVFLIILIGYQTDMQHPIVHDHNTFGWVLFGIIFFIYILISHAFFYEKQKPEVQKQKTLSSNSGQKMLLNLILIVCIILITITIPSSINFKKITSAQIFENKALSQPIETLWIESLAGKDNLLFLTGEKIKNKIEKNYISKNQSNTSLHTQLLILDNMNELDYFFNLTPKIKATLAKTEKNEKGFIEFYLDEEGREIILSYKILIEDQLIFSPFEAKKLVLMQLLQLKKPSIIIDSTIFQAK